MPMMPMMAQPQVMMPVQVPVAMPQPQVMMPVGVPGMPAYPQ